MYGVCTVLADAQSVPGMSVCVCVCVCVTMTSRASWHLRIQPLSKEPTIAKDAT